MVRAHKSSKRAVAAEDTDALLQPSAKKTKEGPKKQGEGKATSKGGIKIKNGENSTNVDSTDQVEASGKATNNSQNGATNTTVVKDEPIADIALDINEPSTSNGIMNQRGRSSRAAAVKANIDMLVKDDIEGDNHAKKAVKRTTRKSGTGSKTKSVKVKEEDAEEIKENKTPKTSKGKSAKGVKDKSTKVKNEKKDPPKKSGVVRTLVKKGRAAVDSLCPVATASHVLEEGEDIWDCLLNQTNIQFNNNKYYIIQLLEDDRGGVYSVWMRWGRVGANGQNCLKPCGSNLNQAQQIFTKKFSDKTRNEWSDRSDFEKVPGKYDLLHMDYSDEHEGQEQQEGDQVDGGRKEKKQVESKLEADLKTLVELICDIKIMEAAVVEMKYDAQKAPLGKLTKEQIKAGYLALVGISNVVNQASGKVDNKSLLQACNDFYTRIPHYFGMKVPPLIRTPSEVREKLQLLEALGDIQAAMTFLKDSGLDDGLHPADRHYNALHCDIRPLGLEEQAYNIICQYVNLNHGSTHSSYKLSVENVFECVKGTESERFTPDVGNRMLLWHGSRLSNWAGILSQGLRIAPPEAPVTGYMFGKGIYFADMCSKSANYCMASCTNSTGLLVLCEVALGTCNDLAAADYRADKLPKGCHSVKGLGTTAPEQTTFVTMEDGVVVPLGPAKQTKKSTSLIYNEYIVYNPAQVRLRYLVKVKFDFNTWY